MSEKESKCEYCGKPVTGPAGESVLCQSCGKYTWIPLKGVAIVRKACPRCGEGNFTGTKGATVYCDHCGENFIL